MLREGPNRHTPYSSPMKKISKCTDLHGAPPYAAHKIFHVFDLHFLHVCTVASQMLAQVDRLLLPFFHACSQSRCQPEQECAGELIAYGPWQVKRYCLVAF